LPDPGQCCAAMNHLPPLTAGRVNSLCSRSSKGRALEAGRWERRTEQWRPLTPDSAGVLPTPREPDTEVRYRTDNRRTGAWRMNAVPAYLYVLGAVCERTRATPYI
jgi:hypothetical protein